MAFLVELVLDRPPGWPLDADPPRRLLSRKFGSVDQAAQEAERLITHMQSTDEQVGGYRILTKDGRAVEALANRPA